MECCYSNQRIHVQLRKRELTLPYTQLSMIEKRNLNQRDVALELQRQAGLGDPV